MRRVLRPKTLMARSVGNKSSPEERRNSSNSDVEQQAPPPPSIPSQAPPKRSTKLRQLLLVIITLSVTGPLAIFSFYYLYEALVSDNPHLGRLFLSPPRTLNLVSILTHSLATLLPITIIQLFDIVRWQLLWRDNGILAPKFLALSAATSLGGLLTLVFIRGTHLLWTWQRILLPILALFLGIVAQANITLTHIFTVNNTVPVFAGLAPLNAGLLNQGIVPVAVLGTYYSAWLSSMIGVPKFVTGINPIRCSGEDCTAIFLPGGVEQIRLYKKNLNGTLLDSGIFENSDVIIAHNAPGYHLEFSPPDEQFSFNESVDCSLYGQSNDQGIYICVGTSGDALFAGWSICPSILRDTNSCFTNTTWTYPTQQNTSMLSFKRFATTAYDRRNLSIIDIENITPPRDATVTRYNPQDFRYIFHTLLTANNIASTTSNATANTTTNTPPSDDLTMVFATLYEIGWALRLYAEVFTNDRAGPQDLLRNMLIIPIHYSVGAWELANSTVEKKFPGATVPGLDFAMPQELVTTASSARMRLRLRAADWTVYAFIGVAGVLLAYSIAILAWVLMDKAGLPNTTCFPEVDIASKAAPPPGVKEEGTAEGRGLASALRGMKLDNGNSWGVGRKLWRKHLYLVNGGGRGDDSGGRTIVVGDWDVKETILMNDET